MKTAGSDLEIL